LADTQTIAVAHECTATTSIVKGFSVSWSGSLQSGRLVGSLHGSYLVSIGAAYVAILVNNIQVFSQPVFGVAEFNFPFNIDVTNWLEPSGTAQNFVFVWSGIPINPIQLCADADLTITASGTITPPPPPPTNLSWQTLAVLVIVIIGIIAVAYLIGEVKA